MHKVDLTFLASSDPLAGSVNQSADGSSFRVELDRPLIIPYEAENVYIETKNATVWYTTPNIVENVNDQFAISYAPYLAGALQTFTIPEGLYTVQTLSDKINLIAFNETGGGIPNDIIQIVPDSSENKVFILFNYVGTQVDFSITRNMKDILGYTSDLVPAVPTVVANEIVYAENRAAFNHINYYLITCPTLATRGLNFNSKYNHIIARVLIDNTPNTQITYDPRQTYKIACPDLKGSNFNQLIFSLTDDQNRLVNTAGEYWSVLFTLHYEVPHM